MTEQIFYQGRSQKLYVPGGGGGGGNLTIVSDPLNDVVYANTWYYMDLSTIRVDTDGLAVTGVSGNWNGRGILEAPTAGDYLIWATVEITGSTRTQFDLSLMAVSTEVGSILAQVGNNGQIAHGINTDGTLSWSPTRATLCLALPFLAGESIGFAIYMRRAGDADGDLGYNTIGMRKL
jgi:hypothetical protein